MKIEVVKNNKVLVHSSKFNFEIHPLWLRERVKTEDLVDKNNHQRLYDPSELNIDIQIKTAKLVNNSKIIVEFNDGCIGEFYITKLIKEYSKEDIIPNRIAWESKNLEISIYEYNEKFNDSIEMSSMLIDFFKYGFAIIKKVPAKNNAVVKFAELIGAVRQTNFGKLFNVISEKKPYDLAYTPMRLSPHTDNPYRKPVPGIQLLHCIVNNAKGGMSGLIDGFKISQKLKELDEEAYDKITSTKIRFKFTGSDIVLENWGELIELDENKKFKQIRFSSRLDFVPALKPEELEIFYRGRKKIFELLNDNKFEFCFRLEEGMLMIFDNHRLLHSRTAYDPSTGDRHLQGCYIEHDAVDGKLRYLDRKYNLI